MDGRTARAARNRQAVLDAALALMEEGNLQPTAQSVAERAGVATRSVFHHFADLESLYLDAAQTQIERHWLPLLRPVNGSLEQRIDGLLKLRAELYERISGTRRAAQLREHESPVLAERLGLSRAALRAHLRENLPELEELAPPAREAVFVAGAWETWEVLRRHQGLSIPAARAAVAATLTALIAGQRTDHT
ncbi:TetR/AcrR family transcriptional regulator [Nocardia yunnanensis]|uniref:TetR/AcrR family transcriptional regulator n=1 Tax=Nocardia yunnanensis TaxID=2382165 RepID=A0A386ZGC3_9NOCA|nr:TetR/AcrR family transcriptional regulator [Nocardia yunnanensis]AYF76480.1 TetR/AcrR family transcriptional regulator [Nocardia yunnanensis]